ncbi:MAG: hypothetical protein JSW39_01930, partial [Desulfobacterales bacterium]
MKATIFITFMGLLLLGGCVSQQEIVSLDNRLTQLELQDAEARKNLESRIEDYSSQEQDLRKQSASLRSTIEELREEMRGLTGRLEEMDYSVKQQSQQTQELAEAANLNQERIARIEQALHLPSGGQAVSPAKPGTQPPTATQVPEAQTETDMYLRAKQEFDQGEYGAARKGFQELIKSNP